MNQPSQTLNAAPTGLPGELRERFDRSEPYAQGSTGVLYLAREAQSQRQGVLKLLHARIGASEAERQRLRRELAKQVTLTNPHLALPVATGETTGGPEGGRTIWLFRDWVDGVTLRTRIDNGGALPVGEALAIGAQLASALDELHRAGLLHRDLRPSHVVLQPREGAAPNVVVIDAGIAPHVETDSVFEVMGSPGYLSPEQASGKLVSFRSDLYALGCILHEMLTGAPLFPGDDVKALLQAHAEEAPPPPPPTVPPEVAELMKALLAKEPRERPFSAQQVRRVLDPFAGAKTSTAPGARSPLSELVLPEQAVAQKPRPKATIMGMPAVGRPPSPPAEQPLAPPIVSRPPPPPPEALAKKVGPSVPPPPRKPNVESTEELSPIDIDSLAIPVSVAALDRAAAKHESLDYDDLAPTKAHDRDQIVQSPTEVLPIEVPIDPAELKSTNEMSFGVPIQPTLVSMGGYPPGAPGSSPLGLPQTRAMNSDVLFPEGQPQAMGPVSAWDISEPPLAPTAPPVESTAQVRPQKKKRSALGITMMILFGLLAACLLFSVGGVAAAYFYLRSAGQDFAELMNDPSLLTQNESFGLEPIDTPPSNTQPANTQQPYVAPANTQPANVAPENLQPANVAPENLQPTNVAPAEPTPEQLAAQRAAEEQARLDAERAAREQEEAARAQERADREAQAAAEREARLTTAQSEREQREAERAAQRAERDAAAQRAREEREARQAAERERQATEREQASATASPFEQLREQAREHFTARRYREAAAAYERAAAMNPSHAGSFAGLGAARRAMGDMRGAIAAYERAAQLQPGNAGFLAALGSAYEGSGDRANAIRAYQRALQVSPQNGAAQQGLTRLGAQ